MEFRLRPWEMSDLESVTKNAGDPEITRFMSDGFPDCTEKWQSFLQMATTNKSILYLAIEIGSRAVGGIGITPLKDIKQTNAELGYWLGQDYQGKGIMSRAIPAIVHRAFEKFTGLTRIYATPFGTNFASHRVLEKAGFQLEARFEKIILKNGELLDELVYALRRG